MGERVHPPPAPTPCLRARPHTAPLPGRLSGRIRRVVRRVFPRGVRGSGASRGRAPRSPHRPGTPGHGPAFGQRTPPPLRGGERRVWPGVTGPCTVCMVSIEACGHGERGDIRTPRRSMAITCVAVVGVALLYPPYYPYTPVSTFLTVVLRLFFRGGCGPRSGGWLRTCRP